MNSGLDLRMNSNPGSKENTQKLRNKDCLQTDFKKSKNLKTLFARSGFELLRTLLLISIKANMFCQLGNWLHPNPLRQDRRI